MSAPKVSTTTETITPKMAESWLEKNKENRPVRDHHVRMLAEEMRHRWKLNGEAIVFDYNGNLLDGQHRLWACYDHEVPFDSVVVRGVEPAAFSTLDSGMKRSAGDVLAKAGMAYGTLTAASLRLVHFYETGRKDHLAVARMSNAETLAVASKYPRIAEAIEVVGPSVLLKRLCSLTALGALAYFITEADKDSAKAFLDALATGENLKRGDPRLTARNYFINARGRGARIHHRVQFALLIKAWNAWVEGRDIGVMRFVEGEEFPEFAHRHKRKKPHLKVAA
jgi:hypothetical protein